MKRLALVMLAMTTPAFAAERATLANGFLMDCHHHALVDGKVRLYTEASEKNYIEFAPAEIVGFETAPDIAPAPAAKSATASAGDWHEAMADAGHTHNIDVALLASVVQAESGGNPKAKSHAGAQGLMQLMPKTASQLGVNDSYQPEENVRGGATYLDALLTRYHDDLPLALAAYNAGPAAVDKYHGIPPYHETQAYVARVIREFNRRVRNRQTSQNQSSNGGQ